MVVDSGLSKIPKIMSQDKICEQPSANIVPSKPLFTASILVPCLFVASFLYWLFQISAEMDLEAQKMSSESRASPIKEVWLIAPITASIVYPIVVLGGKHIMSNYEPFDIQQYMFIYNLYQVLLNIWTVYEMCKEVYTNPWYSFKYGFLPWGHHSQPGYSGYRIQYLVWVHYNNKFVELLDTLWMVLKKNNKQISFLHCYHHMLLIWVWFHCCMVDPGGEAWFGACINSLIHVYMYGYYTLSLLKFPVGFMKIYMTSCQMLQFVICLIHASYVAYYRYVPLELAFDQAFVMVNMLGLFGQFFYKSYIKSKDDGEGDKVKSKGKGKENKIKETKKSK
jgi:elongation of very long chain fatty acids protein 4